MKAPVRDVDIRRAASIAVAGTVLRSTMMIKPRWEQTRLLDFRVKTSSVGPRCDHGAEPVVSLCPVTPTRANPCMISIGVTHSVAIGASSIPRMNLQAEAQAGHDPEQDTVHMQAQSSARKGRRLVAKCLCAQVKSEARGWLPPLQVGVAVPLGAEAAIHSSRHWVHTNRRHPDKVFLKLDFVNAFNTVDRAALLREVRLRVPAAAAWAEWCYSHHSQLLFQGDHIASEAGVQQGDPLGPLFFALALQPALLAAGRSHLDLCFAYLDDVCLAGDSSVVSAALGRLANAARQVGLLLNVAKCELTSFNGGNTSVDPGLFPTGLPFNTTGEFVLLGAAIGSPSFCHQHTVQRAAGTQPLLNALSQLPDSQTALLLLRHCASWSKLVYSSRVTPPPFHVDGLKTYDPSVLQCLECCCTGALSRGACLQATLSTKCGGLGLRSVSRHSGAAYAASVLATTSVCCSLFPAYNSNLDTVLSNLNESLLASDHVPSPPPPTLRQQDLSRAVDRFTAAELASVCSGP